MKGIKLTEGQARVLTGIVGIPLILALLWAGGWWWRVTALLLAWVGQLELYRMARKMGHRPLVVLGMLLGGVVFLQDVSDLWLPVALILVLVGMASVLVRSGGDPLADLGSTYFGVIYPTLFFYLIYRLRMPEASAGAEAFWLTLTVFFLVWATDIGAYYAGRALGRHKLFPSVSPGKTWEGAIGGLLAALGVGYALRAVGIVPLSAVDVLVLGFIAGVAGPVGDLVESRFKRAAGLKDSGHILPGHGGVLDRFDAMLFVVPLAYLYLTHS